MLVPESTPEPIPESEPVLVPESDPEPEPVAASALVGSSLLQPIISATTPSDERKKSFRVIPS